MKSAYTPRGSVSSEDIVAAAIRLADTQGIENVTWRSLGEAVGMHHTSVYRHFTDMSQLMGVVFEKLVSTALQSSHHEEVDPAERLKSLSRSLREVLREHPTLVQSMVNAAGQLPRSLQYMRLGLTCLSEMGLEGDNLATWYQLVETHTMGSSLYDFSGAPEHLEMRRIRYRMLEHPALDAVSTGTDRIDDINESAFNRGLDLIVAGALKDARTRG